MLLTAVECSFPLEQVTLPCPIAGTPNTPMVYGEFAQSTCLLSHTTHVPM